MTIPVLDDHVPPDSVRPILDGHPWRLVWRNELGGLTYEVPGAFFLKWSPPDVGSEPALEAEKLRWAAACTPVPKVLDVGPDWLRTVALQGKSAVSDRWKAEPVRAAVAIGEGLRAMHEALPVETCPWTWSAVDRVRRAVETAGGGRTAADRHPEHQGVALDDALRRLADVPEPDRLVVCHGDTCAPNTLIGEDGRFAGHVDLGSLGVADRWADLAIATWSLAWNFGDTPTTAALENVLLDAYGIAPDPERTAYYRLLWDLTP